MMSNNAILEVQEVVMQFGGLRAIDNVSFHVDEAEIFGLIGPNGAGKTTLFNVITANYKPTSGNVLLDSPADAPAVRRTAEAAKTMYAATATHSRVRSVYRR